MSKPGKQGARGRWTTWRRYVQFCLVGGSGVAVDMALIWLLAAPANLGWNLTLSKVLAAEAAIVNNFLWNDLWTFRGLGGGGWRGRFGRFGKFNLICLAGIGLSVLLLQAQVAGLGMNVYLANFISIVAVSGWNFGMNLKFGWKAGADAGRSPSAREKEHGDGDPGPGGGAFPDGGDQRTAQKRRASDPSGKAGHD